MPGLRGLAAAIWRFRSSRKGFAILWVLIIVFLGRAAITRYAAYETVSFTIHLLPFAAAILLLFLRSLITPLKWQYILNSEGDPVSFTNAGRIFYLSQLSSYIPGGIWQYLDMGYRTAQSGKTLHGVAHAILYLHGMTVATALIYAALIGAVILPAWRLPLLTAAAILSLTAVLANDIIEQSKTLLARIGIDTPTHQVPYSVLAGLFTISFVNWVVNGAFLYALVAALTPVTSGMFLPVSAVMAVSWAAGFLVLVVPGGIGIREGVMILLLQSIVPQPVAITVSVLSRVLTLLGEAGMATFFTFIYKRRSNA